MVPAREILPESPINRWSGNKVKLVGFMEDNDFAAIQRTVSVLFKWCQEQRNWEQTTVTAGISQFL